MYWLGLITLLFIFYIHNKSQLQNKYIDLPDACPVDYYVSGIKKNSIKDCISYNGVRMDI